ncbi:hypothetical protein FIBSPDRAFT_1055812, partial [Athelia psychrophila]
VNILNNLLNGKRDGISVKAPIDISNIGDYNIVDILNNIGKRGDGINVDAPIDISNVLNGNDVEILNNVL